VKEEKEILDSVEERRPSLNPNTGKEKKRKKPNETKRSVKIIDLFFIFY
jgi:hypothetical protein